MIACSQSIHGTQIKSGCHCTLPSHCHPLHGRLINRRRPRSSPRNFLLGLTFFDMHSFNKNLDHAIEQALKNIKAYVLPHFPHSKRTQFLLFARSHFRNKINSKALFYRFIQGHTLGSSPPSRNLNH